MARKTLTTELEIVRKMKEQLAKKVEVRDATLIRTCYCEIGIVVKAAWIYRL